MTRANARGHQLVYLLKKESFYQNEFFISITIICDKYPKSASNRTRGSIMDGCKSWAVRAIRG